MTERSGYKERFYSAFAEFMAESDNFLEEGDYAELIKDGDAITERVYAYSMGTDGQIDIEDWEKLSQLTKDYIDERWKLYKMNQEPLYRGDWATAQGQDVQAYNASLRANIECRYAIEQAIRNNFDGMHLNKGFENALIEKFGLERMRYVRRNGQNPLQLQRRASTGVNLQSARIPPFWTDLSTAFGSWRKAIRKATKKFLNTAGIILFQSENSRQKKTDSTRSAED